MYIKAKIGLFQGLDYVLNAMGSVRRGMLFALGVMLGIGVLFAPVASAGDTAVSIRYVGTGIDTPFDTNDDGLLVSITTADTKGTFGKGAIAITAEFAINEDGTVVCEAGYVPFDLIQSTAILTCADQSQLAGVSDAGYLCLNFMTGHYTGEAEGDYIGGTGRLEGATGTYVSPFSGYNFELGTTGFRSIEGTIEGFVRK